MNQDLITITDAGPGSGSQRYGWTLSRNGEPLARSSEGYERRDHAEKMALQVITGVYAGAEFTNE